MGELPWTPNLGLKFDLDLRYSQFCPNRDFMTDLRVGAGVRSVLYKVLRLQRAGRVLRGSSEARLGAGGEDTKG